MTILLVIIWGAQCFPRILVLRDLMAGRLQYTTTYQAHSLSVAAALAVQKIVHEDNFLDHVNSLGKLMREMLYDSLSNNVFFRDLRGMRFSLEYHCVRKENFSQILTQRMLEKHQIIINGKWHRVCFTLPLILT